MTANTTILKIGNSSGVIIPAAIMKSLSLSVRDKISVAEENGKIILRKIADSEAVTPFTAFDALCAEKGYVDDVSVEASLDYAAKIRSDRNNKDIPQW